MMARTSRADRTRYSSPAYLTSVPPYLLYRTTSPTLTSTGTRLPLSSTRPGPTARTSPSCGFSLAVSGMTSPEAVVCSASRVLTRIRSSSGLMLTDTIGRPPLPCVFRVFGSKTRVRPSDGPSRLSPGRRTPSRGSHVTGRSALSGRECQRRTYARASTRSSRVPTVWFAGLRSRWSAVRSEVMTVSDPWHDAAVDPGTFARLLTPSGLTVLAQAVEVHAEAAGDPVRAADLLRRRSAGVDPALAAAALTQAALRVRARGKFGADAERMWFTPDGLEQATRAEVAAHRAARVRRWLAAAGAGPSAGGTVLDAGCGIGGDLVALARTGAIVAGVDLDPLRVAVAEANLRALELPGAVRVADATTLDLAPFDVVFADPARRTARGRTFDPDAYVPPWSWLERLLSRPACAK